MADGISMMESDSANAADLICQGKFQYYDYPSIEIRDLREFAFIEKVAEEAGTQDESEDKKQSYSPILS